MRASLFLIVVFLAVFAFLRFRSGSTVEGADPSRELDGEAQEAAVSPARFLPRPEPEPVEERVVEEPPAQAPVTRSSTDPATAPPPASAEPTSGQVPEWLSEAERLAGAEAVDVEVAGALLDGSPTDVARALREAGLAQDRQRLVQSFAEALAGSRERAVELARDLDWSQVGADEERLLRLALEGGDGARVRPTEAGVRQGPIAMAMEMALLQRRARELARAARHTEAARAWSDLLLMEVGAPWPAGGERLEEWLTGLEAAQEHHRWDPRGEWPSEEVVVEEGDSLTLIRKRFVEAAPGRLVCTGLIERANRIRGYIHPGDRIRIPTDPARVIVDLKKRLALYLLGGEVAAAWVIGIGRAGEETITGSFVAGEKQEEPMWFPKGEDPVPFGDPRNPLGTRWVAWYRDGRQTGYGFHGTKDPTSIGKADSDGCVRLHNEDVEELFRILPLGAPIQVR